MHWLTFGIIGQIIKPKPYPAMYTQFSRGAVIGTVLCLIAVAVSCKAQAQEYPIAEAMAAYYEASANAQELNVRAISAWAQAGGECGEETETCREWAAESREDAERYRALAKRIRANPSPYNELLTGMTAQDHARIWRSGADEAEGDAAQAWDQADQARQLAELGRNVRTWTRAAETAERVAEAYEEEAEAAYVVADLWDNWTDN